jgi:hypothetical protein
MKLVTIVTHNAIYYYLSCKLNYDTFRSTVYTTCFDNYNAIFRGIFYVTS